MRSLENYIIKEFGIKEALKVNKSSKIDNTSVDDIVKHFLLNSVEIDNGNIDDNKLQQLKRKLELIIEKTSAKELKYYSTSTSMKYFQGSADIAKDFNRNRDTNDELRWEFRHHNTSTPETLYSYKLLNIEYNAEKKILGKFKSADTLSGLKYAGVWFCVLS